MNYNEEVKTRFMTIRQVAATGIISEHYLREMVARGECPGFKSGNRFLVNLRALEEKLEKMSMGEEE